MRNIWQIFKTDILKVLRNVIAMIVVMGVTVVPCLYAWFNIAGSWDPYSNTGNLKVAIASVDEGYEGSLIPIDINVGSQVLSALRENTQMDWVFTSEEKAVNGVKSGKYYAAIVIPEDFSRKIMSLFSDNIEKPELTYYSNAKESAIAPKITNKGATSVQNQINEIFVEEISDAALTVFQAFSNIIDADSPESIVNDFSSNLEGISDSLTAVQGTVQSFADMTSSMQKLLDTTTGFLDQYKKIAHYSSDALDATKSSLDGTVDKIDGATDNINAAIDSTKDYYNQLYDMLDSSLSAQSKNATTVSKTLSNVADQVGTITSYYTSIKDAVSSVSTAFPSLESLTEPIIAKLEGSITRQNDLKDDLNEAAKSVKKLPKNIDSSLSDIDSWLNESSTSIDGVKTDYETSLKDKLNDLSDSLTGIGDQLSDLLSKVDESTGNAYNLSDSADSDLSKLNESLTSSAATLSEVLDQIDSVIENLNTMKLTGDYSELESLISDNKEALSTFFATPVSLNTTKVYPIENYGSSMAPFYSTLSIWIGGIVLVAMLKVTVSEEALNRLKNVKPRHVYFGRYLIFLIIGLMQSTLVAAGDLFYLGIQCKHPFLFMVACWFSSIVYVNIIYTLTVSFGDIGKAISVILLVIQVAGTGGTFPIEVAPKFFRIVYPLLPFTHSMKAMRETIGGMYGMTYWIELGILGIFLVLSLIVGLVLRKPIIKLNKAFAEKLEETKVM